MQGSITLTPNISFPHILVSIHAFLMVYTQVGVGGPLRDILHRKETKDRDRLWLLKVVTGACPLCAFRRSQQTLCQSKAETRSTNPSLTGITRVSDRSVHCALPTCTHM